MALWCRRVRCCSSSTPVLTRLTISARRRTSTRRTPRRRWPRPSRLRAVNLYAAHAISKDEYDTRTANARQSAANVEAAKAAVAESALNLTFTRVTAPITGRVSRAIVTIGNLVTNGQTLLTTVVSMNPIYVQFNADEQAYLTFEKYAGNNGRKDAPADNGAVPAVAR